jgi:hypothetical protein
MRSLYLLLALLTLFKLGVYTQEISTNPISLKTNGIKIKSKHTYYKDNFLCNLFCRDKYIKLVLIGEFSDLNILPDELSVIIKDSLGKDIKYRNLSFGNKVLDGARTISDKYYEPKKDQIKIKEKKIFIKHRIRYTVTTPASSSNRGYRLQEGTYQLYIDCNNNGKLIRSNSLDLFVK